MPEQFLIYIGNCLHGDLGLSLNTNRPVTDTILDSFKVSFDLGIRAILFAFILGVVLGTIAAIKRGKAADTICMFIALIGVSVPSFIMASLLQYYLGLQLGNAMRDAGMPVLFATSDWKGPWNTKILPVLALGFGSLAQISRLDPDLHAGRAGARTTLRRHGRRACPSPPSSGGTPCATPSPPVVTVLGPITRRRAHRRLRGGEHLRHTGPGQVLCHQHPGAGLHHDLRHYHLLRRVPDFGEPGGGPGVRCHRPQSEAGGGIRLWKKSTRAALAGWAPTRSAGRRLPAPALPSGGDAMGRLVKNRVALVCLIVIVLIILSCIIVPFFSPFTMREQHLQELNQGFFTPCTDPDFEGTGAMHVFGTDKLGRDLLTRTFEGGRVSLLIAFAAVGVNLIIGMIYGGVSGYFGGMVDNIMMRIVEVVNGIPYMIVVVLLMMVLPRGIFTMVVAYATVGWTGMARLVRGAQCLSLKNQEFVVAAEAMGAKPARIIRKHLLPNTLSVIIINVTLQVPQRHLYRGVSELHRPGRAGCPSLRGACWPRRALPCLPSTPPSCGFRRSPSA